MTFEQYCQELARISTLSDVKMAILKRLWASNAENFPKPWVTSTELLQLTRQKYFDRRVRELRERMGCDIETEYKGALSDHAWRLVSERLAPPQKREYLTSKQKQALFKRFNYTCAVCGAEALPGLRGLQADHKIPLSRSGSNEPPNWQPLCGNCNVGKRRACEKCDIDCMTCSWAFPDVLGVKIIISMKSIILGRVDQYARKTRRTRDEVIETASEHYLETEEVK